ncbi:thiosulfate ABC transporter substrate-binding protein CysP [Candidatus Erwinia haradaeae]|uniref:Sulfate/thiosulfate-binding periplasmic protein n=1 Tax=Candidatus Erwinia haradaeae TaxID=1922217 RepID=A0A451D2D9_9GAMM|nr:thiosulfate ABC transporter substrate-binding protein CysP [Candidatus Erwinia haradaeae]VFP79800.1 Sulfate/thiosulfate-binding periplasmic protein [Candidatus Erwinia haradaeae]
MTLTLIKKTMAYLFIFVLSSSVQATVLLNSSYDVSRELFSALNVIFEKQWAQTHPNDILIVKQSHAGSSKQALSILQGLKADVVTYNQVTDVQILHDKGQLIPSNWQKRLPNNSSPFYSTMAFLVRKGNPKNIKDWNDLVRTDVKLIFSNPKTSGNGRYAWLAAWGVANLMNENDTLQTRKFMKQLLQNVEVFDTGGRGATTTFVGHKIGDVLISFESEVNTIRDRYVQQGYEVIVPTINIMAKFPVTWIDKNLSQNHTEKVAKAYLHYLYTPSAQKIMTHFYYRVNNPELMKQNKNRFPYTKFFTIEQMFGSWDRMTQIHFSNGGELDQILAERHE